MTNYPISSRTNLVVQEMDAELLIYDLSINKAFCLNQTSAMVWQLCNGTNSIADISRLMSEKLETIVSDEFVRLALHGLKKEGLLEKSETFEINFGGLTRREAVRKVGLTSMVILPIVASVVAPSALAAQSGGSGALGFLQCCTTNSDCASGHCSMSGIMRCCDSSASMTGSLGGPNSQVGCINAPAGQTCAPFNSMCCGNSTFQQATGFPVCPVGNTHQCLCAPLVAPPRCPV